MGSGCFPCFAGPVRGWATDASPVLPGRFGDGRRTLPRFTGPVRGWRRTPPPLCRAGLGMATFGGGCLPRFPGRLRSIGIRRRGQTGTAARAGWCTPPPLSGSVEYGRHPATIHRRGIRRARSAPAASKADSSQGHPPRRHPAAFHRRSIRPGGIRRRSITEATAPVASKADPSQRQPPRSASWADPSRRHPAAIHHRGHPARTASGDDPLQGRCRAASGGDPSQGRRAPAACDRITQREWIP